MLLLLAVVGGDCFSAEGCSELAWVVEVELVEDPPLPLVKSFVKKFCRPCALYSKRFQAESPNS